MQPKVVIGIPTYRRPVELRRLLERLRHLVVPDDIRLCVAVVDNDGQRAAAPIVHELGVYPYPLHYLQETAAGVCHVRNKVLDHACDVGADLVAFVDDDGSPDESWLSALLECRRRTGYHAITGPLQPRFDVPVAPWLERVFELCYVRGPKGSELHEMSAGNALLDMRFLLDQGLRFEPALSAHGGEDTRLAQEIVAHGGKIGWAAEALVIDHVPTDRADLAWLLRRWYRTGNTEAHLGLWGASDIPSRARHVARGAARVVAGGLLAVLALPSAIAGAPEALVRRLYTITRGAGMIAAAAGSFSDHYAREAGPPSPERSSVVG